MSSCREHVLHVVMRRPIMLTLLCTALACAGPALAQEMVRLTDADAPGWISEAPTEYTARELYGYIDGGAEFYLEYGFDRVVVQSLHRGGDELVVEIWRMTSPDGAFGVFSTSGGDCRRIDTLPIRHCFTPVRLLLQKGAYAMTVTGDVKRPDLAEEAVRIARRIGARMPADNLTIPAFFLNNPWFQEEPHPLRYYQGGVALQNNDAELAILLERIPGWKLHTMDLVWKSVPIRLLYLRVGTPGDMAACRSAFGFGAATVRDGVWSTITSPTPRAILPISPMECVLVIADSEPGDFSALLTRLNRFSRN